MTTLDWNRHVSSSLHGPLNSRDSTDLVVLGAGLTGAGTVLELARSGQSVTLIDQDELLMNRASLRNAKGISLRTTRR